MACLDRQAQQLDVHTGVLLGESLLGIIRTQGVVRDGVQVEEQLVDYLLSQIHRELEEWLQRGGRPRFTVLVNSLLFLRPLVFVLIVLAVSLVAALVAVLVAVLVTTLIATLAIALVTLTAALTLAALRIAGFQVDQSRHQIVDLREHLLRAVVREGGTEQKQRTPIQGLHDRFAIAPGKHQFARWRRAVDWRNHLRRF